MNKLNIILGKYTYILLVILMGVFVSSCSSYRGVNDSEDGIYSQPEKEIVVVKEQKKETDNFFAKELDKYENLEESDEIILDAEDYSYDEEYDDEENVESNAAWGYDTKEVVVTHHINYNWYHPYHSPGYYGYNWGYYNWYYPSYYYRPWGYRNYAYYGYGSYYGGGYYSPYNYGGYYSPYYGGYGNYNPYYYGGYGYNAYNQNYTRPYNQYGRRANNGDRFNNRRSLSKSVASNNRRATQPSIIRGSGTISERVGRRSLTGERTPAISSERRGVPTRDNTSRTVPTRRDNVEKNRTTTPRVNEGSQRTKPPVTRRTNTSRKTTPTRSTAPTRNTSTKPSSTKKNTSTKKTSKSSYTPSRKSSSSSGSGYSSGSRGSSSSSGSSSSGSRGSSSSSGSSRSGRR